MANTLISNASVRGFRSTTYNLGNSLTGNVTVDLNLGDVHYGTVAGNVTFNFCNWSPTGTERSVKLELGVSNTSAYITFPSEIVYGKETLENYANVANTTVVSIPANTTQLDYSLTSIDCGTTVSIAPVNRPRSIASVQVRTPAPTGLQGDVEGTVAIDSNYLYICSGPFNSGGANSIVKSATTTTVTSNEVTLSNVTSLVLNAPIIFTGTTFGGIVAGYPYYIKTIVGGNSSVTLSDTRSGGTAGSTFALTSASGTMTATSYVGSSIWKRISLSTW